MATTKIPGLLILPAPPSVEKKEDLQRYVRQLHKSLDEWYRVNREDVSITVETSHSHDNKTILDAITQAFTAILKGNYDDAYAKRHEHSNKVTLDAMQEAFTTTLKGLYDGAVSNSHTHSNKATLDLIQEAFTTALKSAYDDAAAKAHDAATGENLGTGEGSVFKAFDGQKVQLRTIKAGANVSVVNGTNDITISASAGAGGGDVTGAASSVDGNIVLFDGITGKVIKDSGVGIGSLAIQFVDDYGDLPGSPSVDAVYWIRNAKDLARWNGADWDYLFKNRTWEEFP